MSVSDWILDGCVWKIIHFCFKCEALIKLEHVCEVCTFVNFW